MKALLDYLTDRRTFIGKIGGATALVIANLAGTSALAYGGCCNFQCGKYANACVYEGNSGGVCHRSGLCCDGGNLVSCDYYWFSPSFGDCITSGSGENCQRVFCESSHNAGSC
jgi:hypothetical protein